MDLIIFLITISAAFLVIISGLAFLRSKDVFTMSHVVMFANCYAIPLLLIGVEIERFSVTSLIKIIVLTLLNIAIVNLLCHMILKRTTEDKIMPDVVEETEL